jgi:two-component system, NarL family, invasion response regulator UvrY
MIRILIADDHALVRRGLKEILAEEFPDAIIEEASSGFELIKKARTQDWDIIISDIAMPGSSGLESLKQIKEETSIPVLILSMYPEDQYALRVLRAGAMGYLNKEIAPEHLVNAVRKILTGKKYISDFVAERLADSLSHDITKPLHEELSDREFEVMKLIASGKSISEIAEILSLGATTISTFRARILRKMGLQTNADLTQYIIQNKLI